MKFQKVLLLLILTFPLFSKSINGFVRDDSNGEPLAYVNVFIKYFDIGTTTNQDGYFVIPNIPDGEIIIVASIIGYRLTEQVISIGINKNYRIEFRLPISSIEGEEITVSGIRQSFINWAEPSRITLDFRDIKVAPAFVEADVFRTLQNLPGVQTLNDFSSALYVRGSTPDQNLIMLDGITVYNPFHLGGVFSTFNTDAIKYADFHAGGFSAKYGGRMGSILNIVNREGNTEKVTGSGNISLISSKLLLEGPIPEMLGFKGSWMLAGRRTYFDVFANMVWRAYKSNNESDTQDTPNDIFPYYFYDIEAKVNLDLNANNRIILSRFYGDDIIDWEYKNSNQYNYVNGEYTEVTSYENIFDWKWGNHSNSITWRYIAKPDLIFKTIFAQSRFKFWIDIDEYTYHSIGDENLNSEFKIDVFDIVDDKTSEINFIFQGNKSHKISGGLQHKNVKFDLGMKFHIEESGVDTIDLKPLDMNSKTTETALYFEDKWKVNPLFTIQYGLRSMYYNLHNKTYFDPRLTFKYNFSSYIALKLNLGRYHQFLTIANPQDENFRFIDIWMGLREDLPASFAEHTIIGIDYLSQDDVLFRAEAYYKHFENLVTLKQGNPFVDEGDLFKLEVFNEFWNTDAFAFGLELLVKKTTGKVKGWVGYTFAKTMKRTDLWGWYSPKFDRTHTINIVSDWELSTKTHFSTTINISSGNPYTPIIGQVIYWDESNWNGEDDWYENDEFLVGEKNSKRYPIYFRWDIGFTRNSTLFGLDVEYYLQIINVTNHMNPLMYYHDNKYEYVNGEWTNLGIARYSVPMFPILPTFGIRFEF